MLRRYMVSFQVWDLQLLKTLDRIVHEIKVIKIKIQNRSHLLLCAERERDYANKLLLNGIFS